MGREKDEWLDRQENTEKYERIDWIRERLKDPNANEESPGWDEAADEYDFCFQDMDYSDDWIVIGKTSLDLFQENIEASKEIMALPVLDSSKKNLYVMLYAHVVTSVEAFLSSTFIKNALEHEIFMKKLVESDPVFADRKVSIRDIFSKRNSLRNDLRIYLKDLIFHDIKKVKPMYKSVFDIDFGKIDWLFKAVTIRHHCVHRAGYDKEGNEVELELENINQLIEQCSELVQKIEYGILKFNEPGGIFWDQSSAPEVPI